MIVRCKFVRQLFTLKIENMFSFHDYFREQRARQRYSVEVANAGNYLNIRPSTLETLNKSGQSSIYNRRNRKTNVSAVWFVQKMMHMKKGFSARQAIYTQY